MSTQRQWKCTPGLLRPNKKLKFERLLGFAWNVRRSLCPSNAVRMQPSKIFAVEWKLRIWLIVNAFDNEFDYQNEEKSPHLFVDFFFFENFFCGIRMPSNSSCELRRLEMKISKNCQVCIFGSPHFLWVDIWFLFSSALLTSPAMTASCICLNIG